MEHIEAKRYIGKSGTHCESGVYSGILGHKYTLVKVGHIDKVRHTYNKVRKKFLVGVIGLEK